jgi:hypothetical protein
LRINAALLADAASVREGLLHILGGGITRVGRPTFPAPLDCVLVVQVSIPQPEIAGEHEIKAELLDDDDKVVSGLTANFVNSAAQGLMPGEEAQLPMTLPTQGLAIPHPGLYRLNVDIDDGAAESHLVFYAWDLKTTAPFAEAQKRIPD